MQMKYSKGARERERFTEMSAETLHKVDTLRLFLPEFHYAIHTCRYHVYNI